MNQYTSLPPIVLIIAMLLSLALYPTVSPVLGIASLLFSLALSTYGIYTKHAGTEHARPKILKEAGVMAFTLIVVIFLGGIAAMLANYHAEMRWGELAGIVSAIAASFAAGYLVRKGVMKFFG